MNKGQSPSAKPVFIIFRESLWQSIASDACTFGFLCFTFWFNTKYIGGSYIVNAILLVMFCMMGAGKLLKSETIFTSKKEAIQFINSK